jgi:hypothetical protein
VFNTPVVVYLSLRGISSRASSTISVSAAPVTVFVAFYPTVAPPERPEDLAHPGRPTNKLSLHRRQSDSVIMIGLHQFAGTLVTKDTIAKPAAPTAKVSQRTCLQKVSGARCVMNNLQSLKIAVSVSISGTSALFVLFFS